MYPTDELIKVVTPDFIIPLPKSWLWISETPPSPRGVDVGVLVVLNDLAFLFWKDVQTLQSLY
jgi:hypothetical protein